MISALGIIWPAGVAPTSGIIQGENERLISGSEDTTAMV